MKLVSEGIDTLDVPLILEATKEFESGLDELKKSVDGFVRAVKPFKELQSWIAQLEYQLDLLNKVDPSKISDEYKFTNHAKMMNAPRPDDAKDDETNPEFDVSFVAINYPTYVNALRDSILEVAKWLEEYKELFSVGKKGIFFTENFRGYIKNQDLKIRDFGQSGLEILQIVSGETEEEDLKLYFRDAWMKDNTTSENAQSAWDEFVAVFDKIGEGASGAHDAATAAIKGVKPPDAVKSAGQKGGGLLGSLISSVFGSTTDAGGDEIPPIDQNPDWIIGQSLTDDRGIFAMTFTDLQGLITKVLELQEGAGTAGASALEKLDSHQKETTKPTKGQTALIELLKEKFSKLETEQIASIGAALESAGMKDGNFETVNQEKVKQALGDVLEDEDQVKAIMDTLFKSGGITREDLDNALEDPAIDELMAKAHKFAENRMEYSAYFDIFRETGGPDASFDNKDLFASQFMDEVIPNLENVDENAKAKDVLEKWLSSLIEKLEAADINPKENLYRRWGRLAGIIKG